MHMHTVQIVYQIAKHDYVRLVRELIFIGFHYIVNFYFLSRPSPSTSHKLKHADLTEECSDSVFIWVYQSPVLYPLATVGGWQRTALGYQSRSSATLNWLE